MAKKRIDVDLVTNGTYYITKANSRQVPTSFDYESLLGKHGENNLAVVSVGNEKFLVVYGYRSPKTDSRTRYLTASALNTIEEAMTITFNDGSLLKGR